MSKYFIILPSPIIKKVLYLVVWEVLSQSASPFVRVKESKRSENVMALLQPRDYYNRTMWLATPCRLGHPSVFSSGLNHIWIQDRIAFGSETKFLGLGPNRILVQGQIILGPGPNHISVWHRIFLSPGSNRIWVGDQITLTEVRKKRTKSS